ncbi:ECF-type sigma factor [Wenzhouxiangella sediminis]|uniref:Sigma-70 family RNA polymerase sigma factor n=1 Tax=Wenzhouxiangella sediminis TaxID=1792836 RepID=A0A3E1KD52_9GAMM|nr:ECF-type sigma factor [Wenzhouxiangella sediminis]RFF33035.1 sigma-70 family RNA polymerase sigma factor [Wenzhouxiangella sediminis]
MSSSSPEDDVVIGELTVLLSRVRAGEHEAFDRLFSLAYRQLHRMARQRMLASGPQMTLDTTGLLHETYLKLSGGRMQDLRDGGHFLAVAARAMRQVIIDFARRRRADKRGGKQCMVTLDCERIAVADQAERLFDLDRQLDVLARQDPRLVQVIECRFFAGLNEQETAVALDTSVSTVQRDWVRARAWFAGQRDSEQTRDGA